VIDVLGLGAAVLAAVAISHEHGSARHRDSGLMWHPDIVDELHDRRLGEDVAGGVQLPTAPLDQDGLLGQHENERSAGGDDRQRLERSIQHERAATHLSLFVALAASNLVRRFASGDVTPPA
jgi:hypothetical protein